MDATHMLCGRYRWQGVEIRNLYNEDSSMGGTELSVFLKWNLISLKWNKLMQMTS